ncbi:MAG TPA: AbrB/MazE/SpoVT family DNA-binding domain-containing protein [Chloroflexota bacterium]|nr:AbrB/MazE/SpoVT family DNA-binding domain-containing protein [Chloroflexota bacterium]
MLKTLDTARVRVGPQGRVVIPAALRHSLGIDVGDTLVARSENGRLVLEKPEAILARIRERFRDLPDGVDLADELIAERRAEAKRENELE